MSKPQIIILTLFTLFLLLFFKDAVFSYFSQDDFYHLRTIMDKSWSDIPSFFTTWEEGQTFYRPLSREIYNLVMYKVFQLNSLPYHLVNLGLIVIIGWLVFKLAKKLTANLGIALLALFFYTASSIHSVELYYLPSVQTLLASLFLLLAVLIFLDFTKKPSWQNIFFVATLFVMALLSHSMAIIGLPILAIIGFLNTKQLDWWKNKKIIVLFLILLLTDILYIINTSLMQLPSQQVYQPVFSIKTMLNTLMWYVGWCFGLPEMLVDFIGPGLRYNPNLIKWYGGYLRIIIPTLSFILFFLASIIIRFRQSLWQNKVFWGSAVLFVISLAPFLPFPQHKFVYYLSLPLVWFAICLACVLSHALDSRLTKIGLTLFLIATLLISFQTTNLNKITYWAAKRAAAAKFLLSDIKQKYPAVSKGSVFYIQNDPAYPEIAKEWGTSSKQASYILSGADALKLLYKDSEIKAYFENVNPINEKLKGEKYLEFQAAFPL